MTRHVFLSLLFAACVALSTLVLGPSTGGAQPSGTPSQGMDAAKKQRERGQELYMQRKYDEAAAAFAAAYAIQPYAAFLYNEAVCHQKIGNKDRALQLFRKYLASDPNAPDAAQVRERMQRIEEASRPTPPPVEASSCFVLGVGDRNNTHGLVGTCDDGTDCTQNAGAVLVYDVDPEGEKTTLLEARIISSRDGGDALGTSVAGLRIGSRDVIAAGAPGLGSFFLFYCSTLGGEGRSSSRFQ